MNPLVKKIKTLHGEMHALTIRSGISNDRYASVLKELDDFLEEDLVGLLEWLSNIHRIEYQGVLEVRHLLREEVWLNYEMLGVQGLREQIMLRDAQARLRKVWWKPFRSTAQRNRLVRKKKSIKED